ncbi:MAG: hypothetical protein KA712_18305 [Myxococcales bacterium]|nr:hypothetical protein [Myxococcales bacterium]
MTVLKHLVWLILLMGGAQPAWARSSADFPYAPAQLWSTVIRFLRVDQRFPVLEKDKDAGYVLFEYVDETKVYKASVELVPFRESSGRSASRVVMTVPDLPRHVEAVLLDRLMKKAKDDIGSPAPPPGRPRKEGNERDEEPADEGRDRNARPKGEPRDRDARDREDRERKDISPNAPVRGADGLPRLPTRELPRLQD